MREASRVASLEVAVTAADGLTDPKAAFDFVSCLIMASLADRLGNDGRRAPQDRCATEVSNGTAFTVRGGVACYDVSCQSWWQVVGGPPTCR
jgi:hypothetical protein